MVLKIHVLSALFPLNGELQILVLAEMDSVILMDPFQLGMLCDFMITFSVLQPVPLVFLPRDRHQRS